MFFKIILAIYLICFCIESVRTFGFMMRSVMTTALIQMPKMRRTNCVQRLALLLLMLFPAHSGWTQPAEQAPDTMEARLQPCASCHGMQGQGTSNDSYPRLAGKPAGYLYNQLVAFRVGRRHYPPMNYLLEYSPDPYLHAMADYFAAQRPPLPPRAVSIASADLLALGRSLVTQGDQARGIPACSGCHGPSFTGMEPAIPGLLGLKPSYISAQLGAWRYGTRTATAPDCMQVVAGLLTEADVTAVAAWLSTLPAPDDVGPSPRGTLAMPLACGSEPS